MNPEAPWVPREDLSSTVVGGRGGPREDWSTLTVGARGPGVREGATVGDFGEGGSSTGTFSGSPAVAPEETEDLSSVLGAGGCPG